MSVASFRRTFGKSGMGRFVVSEGIAPSVPLTAHPGLPTLWEENDGSFLGEVVMTKGTILSVVADANGDARLVPANGSGSNFVWGDGQAVNVETGATPASGSGTNVDTVTVPARSAPIGCAQFNVLRPFDKGTDVYGSWITTGYVEWPMVNGLNNTIVPGNYVRADALGRPVLHVAGTDDLGVVGKVVEVEKFATNFDDGLLSYMQLPSDPGVLKSVYELSRPGPYQGKLGIRKNLDVVNAVGAIRVVLTLT